MAYVGNQTTNSFTSMTKQDITGNGGASYTLSHAVANAQEIEVFVNNVRQEAGVAYTTNGTALNMTGNVASSDDFYVVFQGKAVGTIVPPDGSVGTAKIIDGSVTSAKLDTNISIAGDLTVDTNTLKVDSTNNRVGIGTAVLNNPLHVALTPNTASKTSGSAFDDGAVRLEGSLNATDAETAILVGNNDSLSAGIGFARENSATWGTQLRFYNHSPSITTTDELTERMRIDATGSVIINDTVSGISGAIGAGLLHINRAQETGNSIIVQDVPENYTAFAVRRSGTAGVIYAGYYLNAANSNIGSITVSNTGTAFNTSSDHRLKTAVNYDFDATTRLKQLKPARFKWIADGDDAVEVDGFLAHECGAVPEAVTGTKDAVRDVEYEVSAAETDADGNVTKEAVWGTKSVPDYQSIDQSKIVPLLCKTILELEARITALEAS